MSPEIPAPAELNKLSVGSLILTYWENDRWPILYEAKITGISGGNTDRTFSIHYPGWNRRYDEKVKSADAAKRFKKHSEQAVKEFKELHQLLSKLSKASDACEGSQDAAQPTAEVVSPSSAALVHAKPKQIVSPKDQRYEKFRAHLRQAFDNLGNAGEFVAKGTLVDTVQGFCENDKFTQEEIATFLEQLSEDNEVMEADDSLVII